MRTPIGKFGGSLASLSAADMGAVAAKAAMERAGIQPEQVEETIFGNARQAGGGPNPARQISIRSGVPQEVPAFTVNKACASGLKSIALAYQAILLGDATCILAGGTESMSRVPYYLEARWGRSEEHTSELQSHSDLVCRLLLEKKKERRTPGMRLGPGRACPA